MIDGKIVLAEVGVGPLNLCFSALHWERSNTHFMLFEPLPDHYDEVKNAAAGRSNVEIHNVAIGDEDGTAQFQVDGSSSAISGINSPIFEHRGTDSKKIIDVQVRKISNYDFGQIDVLRCDTEGAEWFCIKHLVSRPKQIVIEMYNHLGIYINPYLIEIDDWAKSNGYQKTSVANADFVYELK